MPFVTSKLANRTKTINRKFEDGQSINIRYRPHVYNFEDQLQLTELISNDANPVGERFEALVTWFCGTVEWCDWTEDEGGPEIPITPDAVRAQNFDLVMFIFQMIGEDKQGKGWRAK